MGDSDPPSSDRRSDERFLACHPASLERADGEERAALIHDLSESGVLLFVRTSKMSVNDEVKLSLYLSDDAEVVRSARGKVVRVENMAGANAGPWFLRVAVQFDEPIPVDAADVAAFRERALRLGIRQA
jgi:hypothetical protein